MQIDRRHGSEPSQADLAHTAHETDQKMQDVEYELLAKPLAASDDKTYISAWKIYYNLLWLAAEIGPGAGDVAGGDNFRPTDTEVQLFHDIEQKLTKAEADYNNLMVKELPAFNHTLADRKVTPIAITAAPDGR